MGQVGDVKRNAEAAGRSGWARTAVLAGWAAKGVVYLALAWLVLQLAQGRSSEETSPAGALELIRDSAAGTAALVVVGVGLLFYAVGRVLEVTTLATSEIDGSDKAQAAVLTVIYGALAVSALTLAAGAGDGGGGSGSGGGEREQQGTALLLGLPGGRVIVGLLGLAVLALAAYTAYKGVTKAFLPTLRSGAMSPAVRTWATRLGTAAYVTKGLIFALLGWFLIRAALDFDAGEATGLDGALRRVAEASWGQALLTAVAAGLLAYGLFCVLEARFRRVGTAASGTT